MKTKVLLIAGALLLGAGFGLSSFQRQDSAHPTTKSKGNPACEVYGKVRFVDYGEDYKVKYVDYGEDVKIKFVDYGEQEKGRWKEVEYGEDFKIKIVDYGEDFKVKKVDYGEGC